MNRPLSRILFVGAGAAAVIALSAQAAFASTWSISPAGNFTGTLNAKTTTQLKDLNTGIQVTCTKSTSKGNVPKAGSGLSGTGIATITSTTFGTTAAPCTVPGVATLTSVSLNTPWKLNAVSYNAKVDGGQTTGTITAPGTGVGAKLSGTVLGIKCTATVGGTTAKPAVATGLYDNGSHLLAILSVSNLKVLSSTCPSITKNDGTTFFTFPASKAGTAVTHGYSVSSKIHLSSP
jgi:hypothetical protein